MDKAQIELMACHSDKNRWWPSARRRILQSVLRKKFPGGGLKILEAGSGPGWNLQMLTEFGEVTGLEPEPFFYEFAKKLPGDFTCIQGGVPTDLGQSFDLICLLDVLEHLEHEEEALSWVRDHLTENGRVVITVPAFQSLWSAHDVLSHHYRRYTRRELCQRAGVYFDVEYVTYFNFFLFPFAWIFQKIAPKSRQKKSLKGTRIERFFGYILRAIFGFERHFLPGISFPAGVSLLMIARQKPMASAGVSELAGVAEVAPED